MYVGMAHSLVGTMCFVIRRIRQAVDENWVDRMTVERSYNGFSGVDFIVLDHPEAAVQGVSYKTEKGVPIGGEILFLHAWENPPEKFTLRVAACNDAGMVMWLDLVGIEILGEWTIEADMNYKFTFESVIAWRRSDA